MNSWSVLFIALAAVVLQAWVSRRGAPGWYMGCIIPLLYGAAVAWMFIGQDFLPRPAGHPSLELPSLLPFWSPWAGTSPAPGSPLPAGIRRGITKPVP